MITTDFKIESLGYHFPDYFSSGISSYDYSVLGTGNSEEVALDDALQQVSAAGFSIDKKIDFKEWDCPDGHREGCSPLFYVAIHWNNERLRRVKTHGLFEYHDYYFDGDKWSYRYTIPPGIRVIDSDLRIKRDEKKESYLVIPYNKDLPVDKSFFWLTKDRMVVVGVTELLNDDDFDDIMSVIEVQEHEL